MLAAGEGRRLRPFTHYMPKVMIPVGNKPILEYVIDALKENGIRRIIIVAGYRKESIMGHFGDGIKWDVEIVYAFQEKQIGTGHAFLQAKKFVTDDEMVVLSGDNIIDAKGLAALIENDAPSLLICESKIPSKYGVVELENGIVTSLKEKPIFAESNLISTGIYKFKKDIFDIVENFVENGKNRITDALQVFIKEKKLKGIKLQGTWRDIVYPWDILDVNAEVLYELPLSVAGTIEKNVTIRGNVVIGEDTIIHSGSYIEGPVIIGKGCEIGPNTCIFPSTSIGNNVTIHPFSCIRNSVVMDNSTIGPYSLLSNSVVGKGCEIASRFSAIEGETKVEVENEIHEIKAGSFMGNDCKIGANVIVEAGKIIGGKCTISSNKVVNRDVPDGSMVI